MFAYFKGTVAYTDENGVVVDVGGIGYQINATSRFCSHTLAGDSVTLYTKTVIPRDGGEMALYGFETIDEKKLFERLTSIAGIGSKMAMSVLSSMTPSEVSSAVLSGDTDAFTRVSGVGKKLAQRIILELKGKVDLSGDFIAVGVAKDAASEAVEALIGLGCSRAEAQASVAAVRELGDTVEELTLLALKRISR